MTWNKLSCRIPPESAIAGGHPSIQKHILYLKEDVSGGPRGVYTHHTEAEKDTDTIVL